MENIRRRSWLGAVLLALGMVLVAVSAKLALIDRYGTDQPYADQWAAEGMYFLRGPLYYDIDLTQILSSHGEHRPGLTRLWVRGLILANSGQWDCFVELVANLLIYAAFLAIAWRALARLVDGIWLIVVAALMAVLFALPCAYENFLWGFQSCFLFMLLAGLLHIAGTLGTDRLGVRWGLAQLAGLLGLFSIAAGVMSAAALMVLAGLELLRGRRNAWVWGTLVVNAILFGLGVWLLPAALVPAGSKFSLLGQAVAGMGYLLSWPLTGAWWCLLLQAPWVVLLINSWRSREGEAAAGDRMVVAAGLWVAGIACSIAYGRALTSGNIGVRYYDVLLVGLLANILAWIRCHGRLAGWRRLGWAGVGLVWLVVVALGLRDHNNPDNLGALFNYQHDLAVEQRQIVRDFLVTSDPAKLREYDNVTHRFPHFQITLDFLRDPKVPPFLPPSLTPDGHAGPLSRLAVRIAATWRVALGAGVILLIAGAFLHWTEGWKKSGA